MEERLLKKSKLTYVSHEQHTSESNHLKPSEIQIVPHISSTTVENDDDALPSCNQHKLCLKSHRLHKKSLSEEIQQKFDLLDKENEKIQSKVKKLTKSIDKKDKTISDLNSENTRVREQLEETIKRLTDQNLNLIELANTNNRLKKEIEKNNSDMLAFKSQMNKNELIKSNLMKDIDFYKMELNATKKENTDQLLKYSEKEYESLQKKFFEIKIENNKICKKFKEIRSDDENCPRSQSYHILCKKYEIVQNDFLKLKMENKKLKDKVKRSMQTYEDQTRKLINSTTHLKTEEIEQLVESKKHLEKENENYKKIVKEIEMEEQLTKHLTTDLQHQLLKKEGQHEQYQSEILNLKTVGNQLENQIKTLLIEKEEVMKQYLINEENNNKLKLKLEQLLQRKPSRIVKEKVSQTLEDKNCENCSLLKQELEKIGYANLRLNKEKQNLQTNFQRLSIKTSKLTLKMEELELEKQRLLHHECEITTHKCGNEETVLQKNVLLSKRLHNLLKKSEKLFHAHVIQQQQKIENDSTLCITSNNKMIDEINENLSYSKLNLENIENKLNEEEWKLNAALKHIRSVKEHIKAEL